MNFVNGNFMNLARVLVEQVKVTLELLDLIFLLVWEFSDLEGSFYVLEY